MNFLKRSMMGTIRMPKKSFLLFSLILILSVLISGAVLVRHAVQQTEMTLRRKMPGITSVLYDWENSLSAGMDFPSPELIYEISNYPQVLSYDFTIDMPWGVYNRTLSPIETSGEFPMVGEYDEMTGLRLRVRGVQSEDFLSVRSHLLELLDGRAFEPIELVPGSVRPVIVSASLADANRLSLGSTFPAEVLEYEHLADGNIDLIDDSRKIELTVVGIFQPLDRYLPERLNDNERFQWHMQNTTLQHRVYVPNWVAYELFQLRAELPNEPMDTAFINFFILNDPLEVESFAEAVANLSGNWTITDLSSGFSQFSVAMANMNHMATMILWGGLGAVSVIISLIIYLYLRDRKEEVGIYLALGERRGYIVLQFLVEVIPIAIISMSLALLIGGFLSDGLSNRMLEQQLIAESGELSSQWNLLEELGYRFDPTDEQLLESYELTMNFEAVIIFYSIVLGTVLLATVIPLMGIMTLNPKDIMV
ncbi:MAG: ABC transporter permease [Turicibacter sp.]|nr:ABC transporter permease [Turicibacter sp.]